jgi:hypothetical protein
VARIALLGAGDGHDAPALRHGARRRIATHITRARPSGGQLDMVMKGLTGAVMAFAAGSGYRQLELEFVKTGTSGLGSTRNVAVGNSVAHTNYHANTVMRTIRICKYFVSLRAKSAPSVGNGRGYGSSAKLRLQVVLFTDLTHQFELGFEKVDVLFGVCKDVLKELTRDVVAAQLALGDGILDGGLRGLLDL